MNSHIVHDPVQMHKSAVTKSVTFNSLTAHVAFILGWYRDDYIFLLLKICDRPYLDTFSCQHIFGLDIFESRMWTP